MTGWMYDPHCGGVRIPDLLKEQVCLRVCDYANKHFHGMYLKLGFRFKKQFCYIDVYKEPSIPYEINEDLLKESKAEFIERLSNTPKHLCRLRYFGCLDSWSLAFLNYRYDRYEPHCFDNGKMTGTLEEAFQTASINLI